VPWARDLVRLPDGRVIGVPHWVCGNFLFYRAGDAPMSRVQTLAGLRRVLGTTPVRRGALLLDGAGTSTLGELYIDALMDRYGRSDEAIARAITYPPDGPTIDALEAAIGLNHEGLGASDSYHNAQGFYARQFARRQGRALVGYSERLYFVLQETMQSCRDDDGARDRCLKASDIRVTDWPSADTSHPIGWTDILAVHNRASDQKRADARTFIAFMMSPDAYDVFLAPAWGEAPRFLLPARDDLYDGLQAKFDASVEYFPAMARAGTLYREMRALIGDATPIHAPGLNGTLRNAARCIRYEWDPRGSRPAHCVVAAH
jgi:thiamine pyridinylase